MAPSPRAERPAAKKVALAEGMKLILERMRAVRQVELQQMCCQLRGTQAELRERDNELSRVSAELQSESAELEAVLASQSAQAAQAFSWRAGPEEPAESAERPLLAEHSAARLAGGRLPRGQLEEATSSGNPEEACEEEQAACSGGARGGCRAARATCPRRADHGRPAEAAGEHLLGDDPAVRLAGSPQRGPLEGLCAHTRASLEGVLLEFESARGCVAPQQARHMESEAAQRHAALGASEEASWDADAALSRALEEASEDSEAVLSRALSRALGAACGSRGCDGRCLALGAELAELRACHLEATEEVDCDQSASERVREVAARDAASLGDTEEASEEVARGQSTSECAFEVAARDATSLRATEDATSLRATEEVEAAGEVECEQPAGECVLEVAARDDASPGATEATEEVECGHSTCECGLDAASGGAAVAVSEEYLRAKSGGSAEDRGTSGAKLVEGSAEATEEVECGQSARECGLDAASGGAAVAAVPEERLRAESPESAEAEDRGTSGAELLEDSAEAAKQEFAKHVSLDEPQWALVAAYLDKRADGAVLWAKFLTWAGVVDRWATEEVECGQFASESVLRAVAREAVVAVSEEHLRAKSRGGAEDRGSSGAKLLEDSAEASEPHAEQAGQQEGSAEAAATSGVAPREDSELRMAVHAAQQKGSAEGAATRGAAVREESDLHTAVHAAHQEGSAEANATSGAASREESELRAEGQAAQQESGVAAAGADDAALQEGGEPPGGQTGQQESEPHAAVQAAPQESGAAAAGADGAAPREEGEPHAGQARQQESGAEGAVGDGGAPRGEALELASMKVAEAEDVRADGDATRKRAAPEVVQAPGQRAAQREAADPIAAAMQALGALPRLVPPAECCGDGDGRAEEEGLAPAHDSAGDDSAWDPVCEDDDIRGIPVPRTGSGRSCVPKRPLKRSHSFDDLEVRCAACREARSTAAREVEELRRMQVEQQEPLIQPVEARDLALQDVRELHETQAENPAERCSEAAESRGPRDDTTAALGAAMQELEELRQVQAAQEVECSESRASKDAAVQELLEARTRYEADLNDAHTRAETLANELAKLFSRNAELESLRPATKKKKCCTLS